MVYTDLYTAVKLNGWEDDQASGAELTVKDFDKLNETEDYVINKVNQIRIQTCHLLHLRQAGL